MTNTPTTTTDPCELRMTPHPQDAARRTAPPSPGREQLMGGDIWYAMCLAEYGSHKLYDCDARQIRDRADPTLQAAIRDLREALLLLTGEAE